MDLPGSEYDVNNDFVLRRLRLGSPRIFTRREGEGRGHSDGEFVVESPTASAVDLPRS